MTFGMPPTLRSTIMSGHFPNCNSAQTANLSITLRIPPCFLQRGFPESCFIHTALLLAIRSFAQITDMARPWRRRCRMCGRICADGYSGGEDQSMFMPVRQAAKKWGISDPRVRSLCAARRVPGAQYAADSDCFRPLMDCFQEKYGVYPKYLVADASVPSREFPGQRRRTAGVSQRETVLLQPL